MQMLLTHRQMHRTFSYNRLLKIILTNFPNRWDYFMRECGKRNISGMSEVTNCALDSGILMTQD